jgi:hypothetical protein
MAVAAQKGSIFPSQATRASIESKPRARSALAPESSKARGPVLRQPWDIWGKMCAECRPTEYN